MSLTLSGEKVVPQCLEVGGGVGCFARMRHAWVLRTCGPGAVVVDDPGRWCAARESRWLVHGAREGLCAYVSLKPAMLSNII